jgi:uncharacterized protein
VTTLNLKTVRLRPGEEYRDRYDVRLEPFRLGGERYLPIPENVQAELAITRASTGTVFELRFHGRLHGPCYRCLSDAVVDVDIATREYQATSPGEAEELRNPYLSEERLDLSAWARDALASAFPEQVLCRPDCAGLCPVCGRDLNREPHVHDEAEPDARWAALAELRDRL